MRRWFGPLGRYVAVATLARLGDGGTAVAVVVLTLSRTGDVALAGLLVAALGLPHVLTGFLAGALADRARAPRRLFAGALLCYAAALVGLAATLGHAPAAVPVALALAAGGVGPLLTGGLSGLLPDVVAAERLGRGYALDTATYHLAGVAGPAAVAVVAGVLSPAAGLVVLAVAIAVGAVLVTTLPLRTRYGDRRPLFAGLGGVFTVIWRHRALRSVTVATTLSHLGTGALTVAAAVVAGSWGWGANAAGALMAAFGLGAVAGSLVVARWSTGSPVRLAYGCLVATGALLALAAVVPWYAAVVVLFAFAGCCDGPLLTATFVIRGAHAPAESRIQLFTTTASMKIGASACGAAAVGLVAGLGGSALLLLIAASQGVAVLAGYGVGALRRGSEVGG